MDIVGNLKSKVGDKMALIKCPECNGQVSDRASVCIHCGYPLHKESKYICHINNQEYDIEDIKNKYDNLEFNLKWIDLPKYCNERYNQYKNRSYPVRYNKDADLFINEIQHIIHLEPGIIEKFIIECINHKFNNFNFNIADYTNDPNQLRCPKCGSTAITTEERGYSLWIGWYGANEKKNLCQSCGYKWKPGR